MNYTNEAWEEEQMSNLGCETVSDLIAEVKRLRGLLIKGSEDYTTSYMDLRKVIEDVHWALTGSDVHYSQSDDARIKYALGILSEVIE